MSTIHNRFAPDLEFYRTRSAQVRLDSSLSVTNEGGYRMTVIEAVEDVDVTGDAGNDGDGNDDVTLIVGA